MKRAALTWRHSASPARNGRGGGFTVASRRRLHGHRGSIAVVAAALALGLSACGGTSHAAGVKGGSEVTASPINNAGNNPFTAAVGSDASNVTPPAGAAGSNGAPASFQGNLPGLYGGTQNQRTCDANKLVNFLEANPAKANAWSTALGIQTTQIRSYVSTLTPVLLRTDTRVTNHGYVNGQANPIQEVLQAGTAVFVDRYGQPVVKCYCGNPLTPPVLLAQPVYVGPLWGSFNQTNVTIIKRSTTIINTFVLFDPATGKLFNRSPGANGKDQPNNGTNATAASTPSTGTGTVPSQTQATPPPPSSGNGPSPPSSQSPQTQSSPSGQSGPSSSGSGSPTASVSPATISPGSSVTVSASGFTPGANVSIEITGPNGTTDTTGATAGPDGTISQTLGSYDTPGTYTVVVTDPATNAEASSTFTVSG